MIDSKRFDIALEKRGVKKAFLQKALGMSRTAFYYRRMGKIPFSIPEMNVVTAVLNLSVEERKEIFHLNL